MAFDSVPQCPELVYVSDAEPGIRRRRAGTGFGYRLPDGSPLKDPAEAERIRRLAIPPAWTEVWISPDPCGHIQATGRDAKGRKQYRYHPLWVAAQADNKYGRMAAFGRALPRIRERVEADLARRGLNREKVLATAVRLMELTLIRVGNTEYARRNKSYGLTTLTKRHVEVDGAALQLRFRGKSGVEHRMGVRNRRLARILRDLQDIRGQRLFKYQGEDGAFHAIESADVNAYIHQIAGEDFSAKDFRTWAGSISAARALVDEPPPASKAEAKRVITRCVKAVSGVLGNTPTVCRACYVHPAVLEAYEAGELKARLKCAPDDERFEKRFIAFLEAWTQRQAAAA